VGPQPNRLDRHTCWKRSAAHRQSLVQPVDHLAPCPDRHGFVSPRDIEQLWTDRFDRVHREQDKAAFTMTIHPDVSGRPQVLMALERVIAHIEGHDPGVRAVTFGEIAQDLLRRSPRPA
jgi:peptidoglycan/xylan/chitin deacetylase (PgdA/CDA1 family)